MEQAAIDEAYRAGFEMGCDVSLVMAFALGIFGFWVVAILQYLWEKRNGRR